MTEPDLDAGLKSLRQSLRQMKALLAWEQLKQSEEKTNQPPSFTINNTTQEDLRNEYSFFLFTSLQLHSILTDGMGGISNMELQELKKEVAKIERQFYNLDLAQRFV